ncbi:MAG TPA: rhomboid family intramembrane serine protease [Burkholderiales bacterium]|nr:rhomboid family intramembrane serine protease [Burkholderiales bacterium]
MFPPIPPTTQTIIIVNIAVFLAQMLLGSWVEGMFALWPMSWGPGVEVRGWGNFQIWQIVTYGFLHGNLMHLLFNMFAVYMFGGEIERTWGERRYLIYYFGCIIGAAIAQLVVTNLQAGPPYPTIGASGAVFGLLLAFGMMFPRRMIMLIFPPIPMPAWLFVTGYGLIELYLGVTGTQQGVAHFAHLGGMAAGFLMIQYWRGRTPFGPKRR